MKGGLIAAIEAFTRVASDDRDFAGELRFVAVPGEEDGGTGTLAAIRRGWTGDFVIVPEPTSGADGPQVVVAHGGALTFTIDVDGRSAHAATRLLGESATSLPYPTTVGVVHGGVWASNVMEQITAELRVGVTIDESIQEAEARFERTLRQAIAGDPWLDAHPPRIERTGAAFGSSAIDPDHPLVAALRDAAESVTGSRPGTIGVPYGCDMALWRREAGAACSPSIPRRGWISAQAVPVSGQPAGPAGTSEGAASSNRADERNRWVSGLRAL